MKSPLDTFPYPQHASSHPMAPGLPDGGYAYVQDVNSIVFGVPDAPHVHPTILGGAKPALYAGDLTIQNGMVIDLTNLSGTFQFDDEAGLLEVAAQLRRQGLDLVAGRTHGFSHRTVRVLLYWNETAVPPEQSMLKIIILEDNLDRQLAMQDCLRDRFHQYEIVVFDNAQRMCSYLESHLDDALIIALDHDLELLMQPNGTCIDPGTGRDVAEFLASKSPTCPVVIHTTNTAAGDGMEFLLRDADWQTHRVHPFGDLEWISSKWFRTVRDAIVGTARVIGEARPTS